VSAINSDAETREARLGGDRRLLRCVHASWSKKNAGATVIHGDVDELSDSTFVTWGMSIELDGDMDGGRKSRGQAGSARSRQPAGIWRFTGPVD
jgi:hypothetical protein